MEKAMESEERVLKSGIFITKYRHYPSVTLTFNWYIDGVFNCMTHSIKAN